METVKSHGENYVWLTSDKIQHKTKPLLRLLDRPTCRAHEVQIATVEVSAFGTSKLEMLH